MAAAAVPMTSDDRRDTSLSPEPNPDTGKQRTRRKSSHKPNELTQKRKPQRGMGVAQLERLRLQESWKKQMSTEINNNNNPLPILTSSQTPSINHLLYSSFSHPIQHLPTKFGSCVPTTTTANLGFRQPLFPPRNGNVGTHRQWSVQSGLFSREDQFPVDPYGSFGAPATDWSTKVMDETSVELSSIPNIKHSSENSGGYYKKKRIVTEMPPGHRSGFSAFSNRNSITNINEDNYDNQNIFLLGNLSHANGNVDQEVEVVAVHRKGGGGGSSAGVGDAFMEYEFFPPVAVEIAGEGGGGRRRRNREQGGGAYFKDLWKMGGSTSSSSSSSSSSPSSSSSVKNVTATPTAVGVDAAAASTACIDLSLKLSY